MTALYQLSYATTAFQNYQICFTRNLPERLLPNEAKIFFFNHILDAHFTQPTKKGKALHFPFHFHLSLWSNGSSHRFKSLLKLLRVALSVLSHQILKSLGQLLEIFQHPFCADNSRSS
jgi:hypothetical protein